MSYILDALKKSEQERQQNNGPDLQSVHKPHIVRPSAHQLNLTLVLVVAIICAAIVAGFFFFTQSQESAPVSVGAEEPLKIEEKVVQEPQGLPAHNSQNKLQSKAADDSSKAETAMEASPAVVLEFWELPDPVQKAIPAMTFSFHVYSDNPTRRTIIINNKRMREGSLVADDLKLIEITEQGVVFEWQELHRFYINVVENW